MTQDPLDRLPPKTLAGLLLCRIVIICLIGSTAIVALSAVCPHDNRDSLTILVGFLSAAIVGLINLVKSNENAYMIREHSEDVSNKLSELKNTTQLIATKADDEATAAALSKRSP